MSRYGTTHINTVTSTSLVPQTHQTSSSLTAAFKQTLQQPTWRHEKWLQWQLSVMRP